ncbi:MAG: YidC/Oxa1 family rane protein insertase [Solirubrobacteraceae bacterium]|nr:YidC/Oxa1 family rane protein insertase [Solirubrobacteraceae bacterium]
MISPDPTASLLALIPPVQWIVDLLHPVLLFFHDTVGVGWGTSIVLLTVVVRALLAPLTIKQFKSMQSMVRVAPELKELQAKHKDDKQRQQQEVMKFYAENKINPFASCLPLVAQMPFFIGLFYLLRSDLKEDICGKVAITAPKTPCAEIHGAMVGNQDFLFISDLTVKATGWVLAVLIVMYISSQLLSSLLTPSTADRNQRMLMYGLPFVFVFFIINFPAGLIVYWITTNLWTVGQGYILRKRMGPITAPVGEPALAGIPGTAREGRGGGFMARLAAATSGAGANGADETNETNDGAKTSARAKDRTPAVSGAKSSSGGGTRTRTPVKSSGGKGAASAPAKSSGRKGAASAAAQPAAKPVREGPPPQPPRKKKKRSGRRR